MLWGNVVGIALCLIQKHFHVIALEPSIYYLDAVPIDLNLLSLILLNIGTLVASMLMMLAPSWLITKIEPAKSIRCEEEFSIRLLLTLHPIHHLVRHTSL